MPIDPRGTPAVNSRVNTDFHSNTERAPYASTTEDLLDRIRQAVENFPSSVTVGTLNTHTREGSGYVWVIRLSTLTIPALRKTIAWQEIERDPSNGSVNALSYKESGPLGTDITADVAIVFPINTAPVFYETYRLNGNVVGLSQPWIDGFDTTGFVSVDGTVGNVLDILSADYRYLDIIILPTSSGDESILPAGQVGFWADKNKTRFYPVNYVDAVGPVSIKRGSPTLEGILAQDIYIEATPGCQLEVTIAY
jgi:hypothetical protein